MIRWLSVVIPPRYLAGFVLLCFAVYSAPVAFTRLLPIEGAPNYASELQEAADTGAAMLGLVLAVGAIVYGLFRVFRCAPFPGFVYHYWLLSTPYDGRQPLPNGPLGLVPQDALLLLLAELAAVQVSVMLPGRILIVFLFAYLTVLIIFFASATSLGFAYVTALGILLTVRLWFDPTLAAGAAAATAVVAQIGIRRALLRFPWEERYLLLSRSRREPDYESDAPETRLALSATEIALRWSDADREEAVGWPMGVLAARRNEKVVGLKWGLLGGFLAGWAVYCVAANFFSPEDNPRRVDELLFALSVFTVIGAAAIRINVYVQRYKAPISFFGRLFTGRWIVPRYDRVLVVPVLAILGALLLPHYLLDLGLPQHVAMAVAVGLAFALLLAGPPSLGNWRLTGAYRLGFNRTGKQTKFTQI